MGWEIAFPQIGDPVPTGVTTPVLNATVERNEFGDVITATIPSAVLPAPGTLATVEATLLEGSLVRARGPLTGPLNVSQDVTSLGFRGLEAWLDRMDIPPPPPASQSPTLGAETWRMEDVDEAQMLDRILEAVEAQPGGNHYQLDRSQLTATGTLRTREIRIGEAPVVGKWAFQLTQVIGGPDIWIEPETRRVRCEASRSVARKIKVTRAVEDTKFLDVQPWEEASVIDARSSGSANAVLQAVVVDPTQLNRLGRRVSRLDERNLSLRQTLVDRANLALADSTRPGYVLQFATAPSVLGAFDANPGDTLAVEMPVGGWTVSGRWRVARATLVVDPTDGALTYWTLYDDGEGVVS